MDDDRSRFDSLGVSHSVPGQGSRRIFWILGGAGVLLFLAGIFYTIFFYMTLPNHHALLEAGQKRGQPGSSPGSPHDSFSGKQPFPSCCHGTSDIPVLGGYRIGPEDSRRTRCYASSRFRQGDRSDFSCSFLSPPDGSMESRVLPSGTSPGIRTGCSHRENRLISPFIFLFFRGHHLSTCISLLREGKEIRETVMSCILST